MRIFTLTAIIAMISIAASAQSGKQVAWKFTSRKVADKTYEIHMTATIGGSYHLYSQEGGNGPIRTQFIFTKNPLVVFNNTPKEVGKLIKVNEKAFATEVRYYEKMVDFVQLVKVTGTASTNVTGKVQFMVSSDHQTLPPSEVTFSVKVGG